jgi:hypothetical protein
MPIPLLTTWLALALAPAPPPFQVEEAPTPLESERALHARTLEELGEGWEAFHHEGLLVQHQDQEKYAERLADQGQAVLEWMDEHFEILAPKAYVRRPILRLFPTPEASHAWPAGWTSASTWLPAQLEVVVAWDEDGFIGHESGAMNAALVRHWLQHKDPQLLLAMPPWVFYGLSSAMRHSRLDRYGKLEFRLDDWTRDYLVVQTQRDRGWKPLDVFQRMTEAELGPVEATTWRARYCQTDAFVRYLLTEGDKRKPTKGLLLDYLKELQGLALELEPEVRAKAEELRAAAEAEAAEAEASEDGAIPEEEVKVGPEEERARWLRAAWLEMEARVVREMYARLFADWKEADWKKFEQAYFRFLD